MKKTNIAKLTKLLAIATCTIVFVLIGIYAFSRLVTPKGSIEEYYDEPKNTIDALFIGSSHCAFSASPIDIYEESGIKTYNISTGCQPSWVSYYYLKEALKYQKPKVIFLEVFGAFYDKSYATYSDIDLVSSRDSQKMKPSFDLLKMNIARYFSQKTPLAWDEIFNFTKYHSRLTELEKEDFTSIFKSDYSDNKGFGPMLTRESFPQYVAPVTDRREPLYDECDYYLRKTIALAKKRGIDIVLFKTPLIAKETDIAVLNTIKDIAKETEVPFIDFCSENLLNIDYTNDLGDEGHLNYFGAEKLSRFMAEYLLLNYPQLSNNNAKDELWDTAVKNQSEDFIRVKFRMAATLDELLSQSKEYGNIDIIVAKQGILNNDDIEMLKSKNLCIKGDLLNTIKTSDMFVINKNEIFTGTQAVKRLKDNGINVGNLQDKTVSITIEGEDKNYSRMRDGLNIAVYDSNENKIFHNFSMAREHQYDFYTS
ncbi:MAG: hypothetical protein RR424_10130 [Oscillospiraceae bacterium]